MLSNNTEILEKKVDVEQSLQRLRRPLDSTTVNIEVYGVYSLPEQWKQKIAENDLGEQAYQYELEVTGMTMRNAKVFARELSEEEKAEANAAANAKGAKQPPAPAKDAKKGPEEPSKDELERIEREKKEKEERDKKNKEEWDSLDEDTRFFRTAEDIFKQPCVKFANVTAHKRVEQLQQQLASTSADTEEHKEIQAQIVDLQGKTYTGTIASEKQGYELVEFEEWVQKDQGCWIRFMKLPPQEDAAADPKAAAAKGAPAKGAPKAGGASDIKPYFGRAWLSFDFLLQPGSLEIKQRVYLETCAPMVKKAGEDGIERYVQSEEAYDNIFESAKSYIYIKITLSDPITPTVAAQPEPLPQDVVPVKQFIRWPFSKDPTDDFKKQVTLAVESLAKEYYTLFSADLMEDQRDRFKSEQKRQEGFEERKKEFLYEINTSGKYHIMKEKMKKTIVRIVKEYFQKQDQGGVKGIYKDERDHFYSQLYAYLVQQMRLTVKEIVQRKKNELHDNITVPQEQFTLERDRLITQSSSENETLSQRYLRLANEYENLYCHSGDAESYILKYQKLHEGDPEKILEIGKFFLRQGKLDKADQYLRDAYSLQIKNSRIGFMYASYLLQLNRQKEAIVILNKLVSDNYEPVSVNLMLSLAYDLDSDPLLSQKFRSIAFIYKMRELEMIPLAGTSLDNKPLGIPPTQKPIQSSTSMEADISNRIESAPAFNNQRLNSDQEDELYLQLADSLSKESLAVVAKKIINLVRTQDSLRHRQSLGFILMQKRNYQEALEFLQWIISQEESNLECICNFGHCHFLLKRYEQAQEAYIRAIRVSSFSGQPLTDDLVLQRLGSIYIKNSSFGEAQVIFEECFMKYQNSFSHLNYGITLIKYNRDNEKALKFLKRANQLNPYNADVWGYIFYASMEQGLQIQAFEAQKEAFKLKISNIQLLTDMSEEWYYVEGKTQECRDVVEMALRQRALKEGGQNSARHQKKLEEFFKSIEGIQSSQEDMLAKFRDTLVKSNIINEQDRLMNRYIELTAKLNA